jgi:tRNA A37 methylthiotransferase MiaB
MKIVLVQPPVRDFYDTGIRLQPLGLCMLKAAVKKHLPEIDVAVKDYHHGYGRKTIQYPGELSYLKEYFKHHVAGPFSMFHQFYHFGADFHEIAEDVAKEEPDLVGISSLFSPYYREALECAKRIKELIGIPVLMGGSHVSAMPLLMLQNQYVDYVIRGEGERPLVEFLRAFMSGGPMEAVPNLGFKHDHKPVLNPMGEAYALEDLGWADFSDLKIDRYKLDARPLCFITTSRGCPHECAFCSVHLTFGDKFRTRSLDDITLEISKRYSDGYRVFDFEDDNLSFKREFFKGLLNRLIALFQPGEIRLTAMNGISYMSLDSELLELMKRAGFTSLNLSLVSSNETILKKYRRPHTVKKFVEVADRAHQVGFDVVAYQILGLPHETLEDMIETMALLARLPVLIGVSIFYLTPGAPVACEFPEMTPDDVFKSRSTAMAIETDQFKRDDLYTLFITARIINFIKSLGNHGAELGLMNVLEAIPISNKRALLGANILKTLLQKKELYAVIGNDMTFLSRFKSDLFFRVLGITQYIFSQAGTKIFI